MRLALIFITLFTLISIIKLEHPGVNNDQLMFVNAASIKEDGYFIWKSFQGLPLMIFPYIGALKSHLYAPIFYFFGVSLLTIRLPQILLIAASLILLYKALINFTDKKIALLSIIFLSLDPSLIAYSRIDTGPTVIEFGLKVLSIYLLTLHLKSKNLSYLLMIYLTLALGIFNKLNFFWFVNAFFISFIICFGRDFYHQYKKISRWAPIILIIIPYYLIFRFFLKLSRETSLNYREFTNEVSLINILDNFSTFIQNLSGIISGDLFFQNVYGQNPTPLGMIISAVFLLTIVTGLVIILLRRQNYRKAHFFLIIVTLLLAIQVLLTKRATSPWHILILSPLVTILFAIAVINIWQTIKSNSGNLIFGVLISLILCFQIWVDIIYINNLGRPTKLIAYSSTIYQLIDYTKVTDAKFICLDADICNQLLSFDQQTGKYLEPFNFLDHQTYGHAIVQIAKFTSSPDDYLYISHPDNRSHFPEAKLELFRYLNEIGTEIIKIKEFKDGENIIFEVYKFKQ